MTAETFLNGKVALHAGDSRDVLKTLADNSIDSIVTDPPYALVSIVKRFGSGGAPVKVPEGGSGAYARASSGFMGKTWDTGETAFDPAFWAECLRVLKPGGYVAASSGTRTYHNMTTAIEAAGFDVRDSILEMFASDPAGAAFLNSLNNEQRSAFIRLMDEMSPTGLLGWCYGSGFPKSHDVAKGLSKQLAGPTICAIWDGWGTALKPAWEPIVLARKPLDRNNTVAANVLQHGTGAINIDACRIHGEDAQGGEYTVKRLKPGATLDKTGGNWRPEDGGEVFHGNMKPGRWPANIIHDGSNEVLSAFPESNGQQGVVDGQTSERNIYNNGVGPRPRMEPRGDSGSAARFFYTAKADADDRLGSKHPTVKPVDLMQWLCRLVTPKGGTVLDPFAGTGTTGEAAFREGFNAILIEREAEYQADIRRRMALCLAGPDERRRESIKAKTANDPVDAGPLFAGAAE